jgi:hypothetical protein
LAQFHSLTPVLTEPPQLSYMCLEGILEEPFNGMLLDLLYTLQFWHSMAKMRMHTDSTLDILEDATVALGWELRRFAVVLCPNYKTKESAREFAARKKRADKGKLSEKANDARRDKTFNANTVKMHFLGDYAQYIRRNGTTDSYSTVSVSGLIFRRFTAYNVNIVTGRAHSHTC